MSFSHLDRLQAIKNFSNKTYDLVIVGGGITGAGAARDAASRGMSVALVEARDFAIGTSSRSSKLIHGGIRYLENLEFKLVFEALSERGILFDMAPHLVHPLRFVIPIYEGSRVGRFKMGLGMWLYDLLSAFETPEMHASHSAKATADILPGLSRRSLLGSFEYSDAYMDDDRLVVETMRAAKDLGADIANFCSIESAHWNGDNLQELSFVDSLTGQKGTLRARQFVSAVGPWTDIFGEKVRKDWKKKLRPTKGVHITFPRDRLPIEKAIVMAVETRIIFVIPRHEMVIVGTTDTDYRSDPADVGVTSEDVDYLIQALEQYFPQYGLGREDIIASYSGVRPLIHDGSESEGKTSREHEIFTIGDNLTFVAGGKYTTYRKMAEDTLEAVLANMPFDDRMSLSPSDTKTPLNPLVTTHKLERLNLQFKEIADEFGLSLEVVELAVSRHGEEALELLAKAKDRAFDDDWQKYWVAEAEFAIEQTCCLRLTDFYWRRAPLFLARKDHGLEYLEMIADCFQYHYGWSEDEKQKACEELKQEIAKELSWQDATS